MSGAFYNEIEPFAAQWIRNLIADGHVAPGVVDERSIEDIKPEELHEFTQCHFFAGIAVWSLALRSAGWPDDRRVWTGSAPCQPFSAAGQGAGFADERHLWPAFHHLIAECRPPVVLGEQVASSHVEPWIDLVQADLEAVGYAFGGVPFPSAGVGAPHIRDRLYWVADANGSAREQGRSDIRGWADGSDAQSRPGPGRSILPGGLADASRAGPSIERGDGRQSEGRTPGGGAGGLEYAGHDHDASEVAAAGDGQPQADRPADLAGRPGVPFGGLADTSSARRGLERTHGNSAHQHEADRAGQAQSGRDGPDHIPGPTNGYWRDADWLGCRDGKWRPVEPGTFPLAHGAAARVGRLRAYGNAINAEAARVFIEAVMECRP